MNSLERFQTALAMKEPDRVPVAPSVLTRAIKKAGAKQYDYHTNPEVLANAQILHCDLYDFDGMYISSDNVIMYEALGGKIIYPDEHSYPFWTDPLITKVSDLVKYTYCSLLWDIEEKQKKDAEKKPVRENPPYHKK